jgi:hypothetical protein
LTYISKGYKIRVNDEGNKAKTEKKTMTKKTLEGTKFVSNRFEKVNTVEDWIKAFPERYQGLPAKIARSFAKRDMDKVR